ncbi:hypothetical protein Syun_022712 [Stephania yunnanensis]|uniref:Beta-glucosidase n=1 Tax=Stephania yunnanensis TaxID=152371 RepID=A0AAP0F7I5_9MAGN
MTFNEPRVVADLGYSNGFFAPARCSKPVGNCTAGNSATEPYIVAHNLILSHAAAVERYREKYQLYMVPWGIYKAVRYVKEHYGNPTVILSENGMDDSGNVTLPKALHDTTRINFFRSYLIELKKAIDEGANVICYFAWSLLNNFEWKSGYTSRLIWYRLRRLQNRLRRLQNPPTVLEDVSLLVQDVTRQKEVLGLKKCRNDSSKREFSNSISMLMYT